MKSSAPGRLALRVARGLALFLAVYSLLSFAAYLLGNGYNHNAWWIDLSFMPEPLGAVAQAVLVATLALFVVRPPRHLLVRLLCAVPSALFSLFALQNTLAVYDVAASGLVRLGAVPFSLFVMCAFALLALAMATAPLLGGATWLRSGRGRVSTVLVMAVTVVCLGVLFPLGQILCFGTTEYLGAVDATVVFGAQVMPDGTPSPVLQDRLDKAVQMYGEGRTRYVIMSGGIDADDVSEAKAMRDYAVRHGVPEDAILIDEYGINTQESTANTSAMIAQAGFGKVAAVSNFYHLARIKMSFLSSGIDVITIPASEAKAGPPFLHTFLRELPGWWTYWLSSIAH
ncbi:MAG: YdcF family protein [Coriobacteriales bacterium]|jgi:vancomycin permeability regulator SanA|nr:YdcF family protein [Coriobacteriales bacterium]